MSQAQVQQLVRMAHQIALNMAAEGDSSAVRAADHICRFWTPAMRRMLLEHGQDGAEEPSPAVRQVMAVLSERE